MMSEHQKQALALLAEIWERSPDVRLGQLFAHLGFLGEVHFGRSLGYIDDDELMSVLHKHRAELLTRQEGPPSQPPQPGGAAASASGTAKVGKPAHAAERTR